jgi:hypothetical protein
MVACWSFIVGVEFSLQGLQIPLVLCVVEMIFTLKVLSETGDSLKYAF